MELADYAAQTQEAALAPQEQDPGKISAQGAVGRKLTYTKATLGTGEYGVFQRVEFIDESNEPGWFFTSSEILVKFFQDCTVGEFFPFVARLRKEEGQYGKLWIQIVT